MTFFTRTGTPLPEAVVASAAKVGTDPINRREFLAIASAFGATTATAYSMLGLATPAQAAGHQMAAVPVTFLGLPASPRIRSAVRSKGWS